VTETAPQLQPLYLLADSQLLFWKRQDRLLLDAALDGLARDTPLRAAYIGASNGDRPEFYRIFEAAMDAIGIADRRMIESSFGPDDRAFLECAQLVVLAGGDVRLGWNTFEKTGMKDVILGRYAQGAVLVGISAGAVQLGRYGIVQTLDSSATELLDVFELVPWSLTRTTSRPSGPGCPARFICCRERPPVSNPLRWRSHRARGQHHRAPAASRARIPFRRQSRDALTVVRRRGRLTEFSRKWGRSRAGTA